MIATPQGTAGKKDGGKGAGEVEKGENEIGMNGKVGAEGGRRWKMRRRLEKEEKWG